MAGIKRVREGLDISQQDIADFLGVHRVQLTLAEKGLRTLPLAALRKLWQIERSLNAPDPARLFEEIQRQEQRKQMLLKLKINQYRTRITIIERKLEAMRNKHEKFTAVLQSLSAIKTKIAAGDAGQRDRLWLEAAEERLLKKMRRCGIDAQQLATLRIAALHYITLQAESLLVS